MKNIMKILLLSSILLILSMGAVCASESVTVNGESFVLPSSANDIKGDGSNLVNFDTSASKGYLGIIYGDSDYKGYITNDESTEYLVQEVTGATIPLKVYSFVDGGMDNRGYFILFEKNNKQYVFEVYEDGATGDFAVTDIKNSMLADDLNEFYDHNSDITGYTG